MNGEEIKPQRVFKLQRRRDMVTAVELISFIEKAPRPSPLNNNAELVESLGIWLDTFVDDPNPDNVEYETSVEITS